MINTKVSIVIPVYNGALLITRCLNSVFSQKGSYNLEVIVIDDGSTDNSIDVIRTYPHAVKLLQQTNSGPAAARNYGIEVATGNYLAFLDADDYWEPEFLLETVAFLETHPEAIAVSVGQKHIVSSNKITTVPAFLKDTNNQFQKPLILDNFFSFWAEHSHVCTGSILIQTEIVKKTGGQRTDLRITEDLEFWAYMATFGTVGFIPKILFVSDGAQVTKQLGWFKKNKQRWASAPTVEKWEERINKSIDKRDWSNYTKARGRIAKNLCYAMIMSNRTNLARKECIKYGKNFPKDKVARLMLIGSHNRFFWFIVTTIIYCKEYIRSVTLVD